MSSKHYRELRASVRSLRKHLLPAKFDPTGTYKDRVFTGVVAFRVLCHAAIEQYFEERSIEIAKNAFKQYRSTGLVSLPALALLGFSGREHRLPPATIDAPDPSMRKGWPSVIDTKQRLNDCTRDYIHRVSVENHGIREKNLLAMLVPIGVDPKKIDRLFLSEIDNFGSLRGDYAHTSPTVHTVKRPDPKDALDKIVSLLNLIEPVDKELDAILSLTKH